MIAWTHNWNFIDYASAYADEFDVSSNSYGTPTCTASGCNIIQNDLTNATKTAFEAALSLRNGKGTRFVTLC